MKDWTPGDIETFRKAHKLSRRALGELLGVTVSSIYQWERGLKNTSKSLKLLLDCIEERKMKKEGKGHGKKQG